MSKAVKKLAIIGFGTVGSGVYETLIEQRNKLERLIGGPYSIPVVLVKDASKVRELGDNTEVTDNFQAIIDREDLDVVVEASPDAEIAYPYVKALLQQGVSVITANKELVAKYGEELLTLARSNHCRLFFEAAVAGGIPILTSIRHTLKSNVLEKVEGILNGTSNFILTKMRKEGTSFETALEEAQAHGYAEAVPDKDVDGWDAYFKTQILSHWIYGVAPNWQTEKPKGVRGVNVNDLLIAETFGGRIKHVASLEKSKDKVSACVEPRFVLSDHALYGVEGVNNGIHVQGNIVGSLLFQGPGAGKFPTASAVVEDLINFWTGTSEEEPVSGIEFEKMILSHSEDDSVVEPLKAWLLTGEKLGPQLENQFTVNYISKVSRVDGREGIVITGDNKAIEELFTCLNDTVVAYPLSGDHTEVFPLSIAQTKVS
ncbi:homoserine dehydrogenase [Salipaludibacillus sp. CF4.18]|uniref:homoserine dehydrogenase n=1 Tax=Salipaludibacillus sp. CF4.18 TaxID=3373081 RepID=UPI003EE6CABB